MGKAGKMTGKPEKQTALKDDDRRRDIIGRTIFMKRWAAQNEVEDRKGINVSLFIGLYQFN